MEFTVLTRIIVSSLVISKDVEGSTDVITVTTLNVAAVVHSLGLSHRIPLYVGSSC